MICDDPQQNSDEFHLKERWICRLVSVKFSSFTFPFFENLSFNQNLFEAQSVLLYQVRKKKKIVACIYIFAYTIFTNRSNVVGFSFERVK
jgi:hypothetical protein